MPSATEAGASKPGINKEHVHDDNLVQSDQNHVSTRPTVHY